MKQKYIIGLIRMIEQIILKKVKLGEANKKLLFKCPECKSKFYATTQYEDKGLSDVRRLNKLDNLSDI